MPGGIGKISQSRYPVCRLKYNPFKYITISEIWKGMPQRY
jgi:hypothetical protein